MSTDPSSQDFLFDRPGTGRVADPRPGCTGCCTTATLDTPFAAALSVEFIGLSSYGAEQQSSGPRAQHRTAGQRRASAASVTANVEATERAATVGSLATRPPGNASSATSPEFGERQHQRHHVRLPGSGADRQGDWR